MLAEETTSALVCLQKPEIGLDYFGLTWVRMGGLEKGEQPVVTWDGTGGKALIYDKGEGPFLCKIC